MDRRREIVIALSTLWCIRGGIQRFNQLLCRACDELAEELDFTGTVLSQDDTAADYREAGEPWEHLRFIPGGGKRGVALKTLRVAMRDRPDALLIGHIGMSPIGVACSRFVKNGWGFIAHGTEAWSIPRRSRRLAVRRASRAIAVSQYTADLLAAETGLDPTCIGLLPNALEPGIDALDESNESAGAPPDGTLELLSVARLEADEGQKGIDHTIAVLPALVERFPNLRYRIVGKGTDKERLIELARSTGAAEHIVFEENLSDEELVARYRDCSVFVLPSGQEGFGIVFLEAMRFGKPCIGGNAGGTPEVIADEETGLLVPFGDRPALTTALERLLGDPELCRTLGHAGIDRLQHLFVYERFRENVANHLRSWLCVAQSVS